MHKEILTKEQYALLPLFKQFSKDFGLVGGTAIALHIGHRRSIDFDFFSPAEFKNLQIKAVVDSFARIENELVNTLGEFTFFIQGVKVTFFHYPFTIHYSERYERYFKLPDLLTLAAMKVYALGQRAKWKDYVDLYFIMKLQHPLAEIILKAREIFGQEFNEKIIRTQLAYFDDVNYSEEVVYMPGFETDDDAVKKALVEYSLI